MCVLFSKVPLGPLTDLGCPGETWKPWSLHPWIKSFNQLFRTWAPTLTFGRTFLSKKAMISQAQGFVRAHGPVPTSEPGPCSLHVPLALSPGSPGRNWELSSWRQPGAPGRQGSIRLPLPPRSPRLSLSYLRWSFLGLCPICFHFLISSMSKSSMILDSKDLI